MRQWITKGKTRRPIWSLLGYHSCLPVSQQAGRITNPPFLALAACWLLNQVTEIHTSGEEQVCGEGDQVEFRDTCEISNWKHPGDMDSHSIQLEMEFGHKVGRKAGITDLVKRSHWGKQTYGGRVGFGNRKKLLRYSQVRSHLQPHYFSCLVPLNLYPILVTLNLHG